MHVWVPQGGSRRLGCFACVLAAGVRELKSSSSITGYVVCEYQRHWQLLEEQQHDSQRCLLLQAHQVHNCLWLSGCSGWLSNCSDWVLKESLCLAEQQHCTRT